MRHECCGHEPIAALASCTDMKVGGDELGIQRLLYIVYVYNIVKHYIQKVLEKEEKRRQLYSQETFMKKRGRMLQEHLWSWKDPTYYSAKHLKHKFVERHYFEYRAQGYPAHAIHL